MTGNKCRWLSRQIVFLFLTVTLILLGCRSQENGTSGKSGTVQNSAAAGDEAGAETTAEAVAEAVEAVADTDAE